MHAASCQHALGDPSQDQSHVPDTAQAGRGLTWQDCRPLGMGFLPGLRQVGRRQAGATWLGWHFSGPWTAHAAGIQRVHAPTSSMTPPVPRTMHA